MDERTGTELTIHQQEAVALTQNGGLDSVIKPLTKEIHLFDTYVAGVSFLTDKTVLQEMDAAAIRKKAEALEASAQKKVQHLLLPKTISVNISK